jgi:DNA repair protein RadC
MSIHDGHRQRLKDRFLLEGLDGFTEVQALELLLFYCVQRQDTNPLAHRLIEHFGSFAQVLEATPEQLKKVPGIGDSAATFLSLLHATGRYYEKSSRQNIRIANTIEDCGKYLMPCMHNRRNEMVFLLCLDAKCKVLACKEVGEGSVNSAAVPIRRIVEMALEANATTVVLAHNHPSGIACPSNEDQFTTHRLAMALRAVEIELTDHLVFADGEYVSMVQSGMYDPKDYHAFV